MQPGSTTEPVYDVAVIGGGVVGIAVARHFALRGAHTVLVDAQAILSGASRGNSAMIHCGFDCTPGSLEAAMVKRGHSMFRDYLRLKKDHQFVTPPPYRRNGALMLATSKEEMYTMTHDVLAKALANGVETTLLATRDEVLELEPHVAEDVVGGLHVPLEWSVDPFVYPAMLLQEAVRTGNASFRTRHRVERVAKHAQGDAWHWVLTFAKQPHTTAAPSPVHARVVINCAGLRGDVVEAMRLDATAPQANSSSSGSSAVKPKAPFELFPRLGRFVAFDASAAQYVTQHALLPIPTKKTKGVIVFKTVHDRVIVGPTAEDPDEPRQPQKDVEAKLIAEAVRRVPALATCKKEWVYAGSRPALRDRSDYFVEAYEKDQWATIAGVRSTGLTSSIALAELIFDKMDAWEGPDAFVRSRQPVVVPHVSRAEADFLQLVVTHPIAQDAVPAMPAARL